MHNISAFRDIQKSREYLFNILFGTALILLSMAMLVLLSYENYNMGSSLSKKYLFLFSISMFVLSYGAIRNSLLSSICFFFPCSIVLQRPLFDLINLFYVSDYTYHVRTYTAVIYFLFPITLLTYYTKQSFLNNRAINNFPPFIYFLLLTFYGGLSFLWAKKPSAVVSHFLSLATFPISFFVFKELFKLNRESIHDFIKGIFFASVVAILFVWPEFFGFRWFAHFLGRGDVVVEGENTIRAGGLNAKADFAIFASITIPFLLATFVLRKDISENKKILIQISIILFLISLAMTLHRIPFIATILAIIIVYIKGYYSGLISLRNLKLISFSLMICSTIYMFSSNISDSFVDDIIFRDTWTGRLLTYKAAFKNFTGSNGLGVGLNNFLETKETLSVLGPNSWFIRNNKTVHNDYLKILSELGIIGLVLFMCFVYKFLAFPSSNGKNMDSVSFGIKLSFIVACSISMTDIPFTKPLVLSLMGAYGAVLSNAADHRAHRNSRLRIK